MTEFNSSISFDKYQAAGKEALEQEEAKLNSIKKRLDRRIGQKSRGKMLGSMFVSIVLAVVLFFGIKLAPTYIYPYICTFGYCASDYLAKYYPLYFIVNIILAALILLNHFLEFKYYNDLISQRSTIERLTKNVNIGIKNFSERGDMLHSSYSKDYNVALIDARSGSVGKAASVVENRVASFEKLKSGFISGLTNFIYFALLHITPAFFGYFFPDFVERIIHSIINCLNSLAESIIGDSSVFSILSDLSYVIVIVSIIGASALCTLLGKRSWAKHGCSVSNRQLILSILSPLSVIICSAAVTIVAGLVFAVIAILVIVAVIATACAFSGGG